MRRYLLQRFVGMVVVMLLVMTATFLITRVAPGDPAAVMLGPNATAADIAILRTQLGLDKPLVIQYVSSLGAALHGDLARSIFLDRPVTQALAERAEPTLFLSLMALVLAAAL